MFFRKFEGLLVSFFIGALYLFSFVLGVSVDEIESKTSVACDGEVLDTKDVLGESLGDIDSSSGDEVLGDFKGNGGVVGERLHDDPFELDSKCRSLANEAISSKSESIRRDSLLIKAKSDKASLIRDLDGLRRELNSVSRDRDKLRVRCNNISRERDELRVLSVRCNRVLVNFFR